MGREGSRGEVGRGKKGRTEGKGRELETGGKGEKRRGKETHN